jgi:tetratricopeptide (TPR) repeat protein
MGETAQRRIARFGVFEADFDHHRLTKSRESPVQTGCKSRSKLCHCAPLVWPSYLAQISRFDEADRQMQQALLLDPVSRIIATDQGVVLYWERRYDDSYQQLTKALALDPGFSEAYLNRGKVLLQQGEYKDAIADLETAYRINPANPAIPASLAYGYALARNRTKLESQLHVLLSESNKTLGRSD